MDTEEIKQAIRLKTPVFIKRSYLFSDTPTIILSFRENVSIPNITVKGSDDYYEIERVISVSQTIIKSLQPLFNEAKEKNLWFYLYYQNMYIHPNELRRLQAYGRFVWGKVNWELRKPGIMRRINYLIGNERY